MVSPRTRPLARGGRVAKFREAMSRTNAIICIVSQLIANYPRIIAVHGDNLNVGTYPDPSNESLV